MNKYDKKQQQYHILKNHCLRKHQPPENHRFPSQTGIVYITSNPTPSGPLRMSLVSEIIKTNHLKIMTTDEGMTAYSKDYRFYIFTYTDSLR